MSWFGILVINIFESIFYFENILKLYIYFNFLKFIFNIIF